MIYLDNSATTKPDTEVLAAFLKVNEEFWFNPSSIHEGGEKANKLLESARAQIAGLLKTDSKSVLFTSGGTEGANFVLKQAAVDRESIGKHILISAVEHPSVLEVGKYLSTRGFEVEWLEVNTDGMVLVEELERKIRKDTSVISIQHINNELGTLQPIRELVKVARARSRAVFHVDAVQSVGKIVVDFDSLPVDWITLSAHKFHGIKGTGIVACHSKIHLEPLIHGGGQEFGLRSGTTAVAQAVSTAKAFRLAVESLEQTSTHLARLKASLVSFFYEHPFVTVLTPASSAPHIVTIAVKGVTGEVLVNALEKKGIYVSTSSACSSKKTTRSHVLEAIGLSKELIDGVIRISMGKDTTEQDVQTLQDVMNEILRQLERNLKV
ncbi:cysteine desulfurase family protein [Chryseomicrobium aureum]|uniref:cysteine desulfurase family protein n=1 Tax=Chryseomicrobium aureum TaxID=1441723 RepID=UPI00370D919E